MAPRPRSLSLMENMIEAARARDQQELDNMRAFMEAYIMRYPPDAQKRIADLAVALTLSSGRPK